ncbi:TRAP transporter small permease subunit [Pacificibacter marinus]|uniref:TRAP transporter small permease protein n=1 Tax=Pacificibacter marinus TaxID=658057 RepID=A0A1Y5RTY5_9RHOB|nr:TRAP transporter small permease [Pacificibacter marinus]SEK39865.1 TRAP-type C4-dicarboxylate transport system, small permease component [Pacificibacter marinus]SLN25388.1 Tripartite ATP-independent periplasmic transporters, DctQ component [Pacificibacter marinus]
MARFYSNVFALSRLAAVIAACALVYMVSHIAYEIILRSFFATSTFVLDEFVGYAIGICIIWSLGYVLEHGDLIRVGLVLDRLPERAQQLLTAVSALVACALSVGLAWMFWIRVARAWSRGTVSSSVAAVPTWIPEGAIMVGLGVFALAAFAHGLRHITGHPSPAPHTPLATPVE